MALLISHQGKPNSLCLSVFGEVLVVAFVANLSSNEAVLVGLPGILPSVGPYSERYARLAGDEVGRSASGEDLRVPERACSEDEALAPWRMAAMDKAATSVQRGGILTEIVIGADGEVIVLGSSGGKRHRALSSDSALCGVGVVNSPSGLKPTEEACEEEFGTKAAARRDAVVSCAACDPAADKPPGLLQVSSSSAAAGPSEPVAPSGTVRFPGECTASLQQSSGNSLGSQAKQLLQTSAKKQVLSLARQCTIHKLSSVFSLLFRDQKQEVRLLFQATALDVSALGISAADRATNTQRCRGRPDFRAKSRRQRIPAAAQGLAGLREIGARVQRLERETPEKGQIAFQLFLGARGERNRAWFSSAPLPPETCSPAPEAPPRQPQNQPPAGELLSQDAAAAAERTFVGEQTVTYANRYPVHLERAIYRLSHAKLANPRRPLVHQVLISNMMFWYLALVARQQQLMQQQRNLFCQQEHCQKQQQHCDLKADHEDGSVDDECSTYGDESELEERRRCMKARKKAEKKLAKKIAKETRKKDVSV
ncbi:MAG: hypothetical protein BJ554DRAFT_2746 [Olpidium bornovanus]|uniref:Protein Zds1 C-terminal domain-containing protein n=1 Tax=Olpidium bornovanus TaxID=278681 RepID=A0A8H8DG24_9FUNG|nr:MAG: hypothetical protein BJ554DRAFT_2746 [Olpidium bornovanus]